MSACGVTPGGADAGPANAPEGRKLLRLEVRNAQTPIERKPEWIRTKAKMGPEYQALQSLVAHLSQGAQRRFVKRRHLIAVRDQKRIPLA